VSEDITLDRIRELTVAHLEQMGPALSENWRTR
jgi:hypothetical protein